MIALGRVHFLAERRSRELPISPEAAEEPKSRTRVASPVAVFRVPGADAIVPLQVLAPWRFRAVIGHVALRFAVPRGWHAQLLDCAGVPCTCEFVESGSLPAPGTVLQLPIDATVMSRTVRFPFGLRFPDRDGRATLAMSHTGCTIHILAHARVHRESGMATRDLSFEIADELPGSDLLSPLASTSPVHVDTRIA